MKHFTHIYHLTLALLVSLVISGCASLPVKDAQISSKQVAIQACINRGNRDSRYAPPVGAITEVYGPWKSTYSFGWKNDGFNQIGDRLWQIVYTKQQTHEWITVIWINAENGNLRIMKPEYPDSGLVIHNKKKAQQDAPSNGG